MAHLNSDTFAGQDVRAKLDLKSQAHGTVFLDFLELDDI